MARGLLNPDRSRKPVRRVVGIVRRIDTRERGFLFIAGADGEEYFAHTSAFGSRKYFELVEVGDGVSFRVARTGKGLRAFDVQPAEGGELAQIAQLREQEENRGNR